MKFVLLLTRSLAFPVSARRPEPGTASTLSKTKAIGAEQSNGKLQPDKSCYISATSVRTGTKMTAMRMRKSYIMLLLTALLCSCGGKELKETAPSGETSTAQELMEQLWTTTSPIRSDTIRTMLFGSIQQWADACSHTIFKQYLNASAAVAATYEKHEPIYTVYRYAFDHVLNQVKTASPEPGTAFIWLLYNMGYVVKTPSGCFGIDLCHRYAEQFVPYLDFLCITHNHQDHYNKALIAAMQREGKPVLSNYLTDGPYTAETTADYQIGSFRIHCFVTNHNNGPKNIPVTVFQVACGEDADGLVVMHSGDSNFRPEQFDVTERIDVYIPRYAPNELSENNVIGKIFVPEYVLLSHVLELTHADPADSRWTLEQGLVRASKLNCERCYLPFWGEKLTWKNHKLE